jgi:hypothetical protein
MSDVPQGPGWWQASDGKWYPPESAPAPYPQAGPPGPTGPPPQKRSKGSLIAVIAAVAVAALVAFGFIVAAAGGGDDDDDTAADGTATTEAGADDSATTTTGDDGGGAEDDLAIDVPEGFEAFVDEEAGVAIALPSGWQQFDLADPGVQQSLDEFSANNPDMAGPLTQAQAMIAAGGVLFAIDPNQAAFAPNINIIRSPGVADLDVLESSVEDQLEGIATNISTEIVDLPVGEALLIDYDLPINAADGSTLVVHGVQYQVPARGSTWAITMTTDDIARDGATFDTMIQSFTLAE